MDPSDHQGTLYWGVNRGGGAEAGAVAMLTNLTNPHASDFNLV